MSIGSGSCVCFTGAMAWAFEDFVLDPARLELRRGADAISMEPQVFQVLRHLVEHADRVVPKDELLDEVWDTRFVSESALTSRIKSARQAVGDDGRAQRVIRTFHGNGYRFVLPVSAVSVPAVAPPPVAATAEPPELTLAVDREFPFVGREEMIDRVLDLSRSSLHSPQAVLLGGEPGVGKSRLAIELAERIRYESGALTIGGRCEQHLASSLQPWIEALTSYVGTADPMHLAEDTAGIIDRLNSVLPELAVRTGGTGATATITNDEFAVVDGLVTLIERVSQRRAMVVVLDDVQWGGGATRSLVSLLLRRDVAHVLLVLTFRTTIEDLGAVTSEWLAGLERSGASRLDVLGLSPGNVRELVDSALGDAGQLRSSGIWERSEGHSLFAVELIRDARDGNDAAVLPPSVASLVERRLAKLPAPVAALVTTGAAFGQEFDLAVVAAVAGLDDAAVLDAAEGALGAQLLREVPGRADWYRFPHQLVPAAALESMSTSRRVRLHAKVAAELDARGGSEIEIAHHLIEAAAVLDQDQIVARVRRVSEAALRMHQYDRAVELLDRAARLDIDPRIRAEVLTELGAACNLSGQQPRALEGLRHAADVARRNGWDDLLAAAALGMWGQSPFRASQDRTVIPLLDESIEHSSHLDARTRARLLAKRAAFNLFSGPFAERDELSARALDLVGPDVTAARLEVLEARWMAIASPSQMAAIVELDAELEVIRKELGALSTDACAPEISIYWRGLGDELVQLAAELRDDPRQRRDVDQWRTTTLDGTFALFAGETERAREYTDQALPLGEEPWGEAGQVVHALVHLVVDVLEGDSATAVGNWRRIGELVPSDAMRCVQAWAEARFGDRATAEQLIDQPATRLDLLTVNFMGGFGLVGLGEAVILLERVDVVPALVPVLEPLADQMLGHPWAPCFAAADVLARLHRLAGNDEESHLAAARARRLYDRLGAESFADRLDDEFR